MDLTVLTAVRPGDTLEIHYINKLNQDIILETIVYDILSENEFLIHNPMVQGKLFMIPTHIEVTMMAKRADYGVVAFNAMLLKREKVGNVYTIVCQATSDFEKQQRRKFFRVKDYHDIDLYYMVDDQNKPVDFYIFDPDAVPETQIDCRVGLLDISGGGFGFKHKESIPIGTYVYSKFFFLSHPIEIQGKVIRSISSEKYMGEFEIGVAFENLTNDVIRVITNYVFTAQQKARRKEMD